MEHAHGIDDLRQMQLLPLEAKIQMTIERIEGWHDSWTRFEIENLDTGKTRFEVIDTRNNLAEPKIAENEWISAAFPGQVYVSFSGGKDSTVLKHIVDGMYDDVLSVFINTGLEYPEIQKFAMSQKNVTTIRPSMRFDEIIKKYGYPVISKEISQVVREARIGIKKGDGSYQFRIDKINGTLLDKEGRKSLYCCDKYKFLLDAPFDISEQCCLAMKKKPLHQYEKQTGRKPIIGVLASESRLRTANWIRYGCNSFEGTRVSSTPLAFWTEQDILHYLKKFNVPYCSVYGDIVLDDNPELAGQINMIDYFGSYESCDRLKTTGCDRTGCIFCMFGCHLEKEPNRFQRMKETHPRQYEYCIGGGEMVDGKWQPNKEGLGLGYVLDYIGVKY